MNKARRIAIRILDEFEELLAEKGIRIPSSDREGRSEEACLYGSEYYRLEDAITAILQETV
jgi:predicted HTH domain antitoxin